MLAILNFGSLFGARMEYRYYNETRAVLEKFKSV